MKLSKLSEDFKNKSFNLFAINVLILSVLPIIFYFVLGYFSGFGFYIINLDRLSFSNFEVKI